MPLLAPVMSAYFIKSSSVSLRCRGHTKVRAAATAGMVNTSLFYGRRAAPAALWQPPPPNTSRATGRSGDTALLQVPGRAPVGRAQYTFFYQGLTSVPGTLSSLKNWLVGPSGPRVAAFTKRAAASCTVPGPLWWLKSVAV